MILIDTVRVRKIRPEIMPILEAILSYEELGHSVTVTGWQDQTYRFDGAHADGRALDLRVWNHKDPDLLAKALEDKLYPVSEHYVVLWNDEGHKDHIHVGYHKETRA